MRVIIVDDDQLVSLSLKTILESDDNIKVVDIGYNGKDAVVLYEKHQPDVILMDIQMQAGNGLDAADEILKMHKDAKILFLTTFSDNEYIRRAIRAGAKGYILKQDFQGIIPALFAIERGQSVFGSEIVNKLPVLMQSKEEFCYEKYNITPKEEEIIALVGQGKSNKEIGAELFLSEGTVRNYISVILEKLALRDRTQLAVFYYTK